MEIFSIQTNNGQPVLLFGVEHLIIIELLFQVILFGFKVNKGLTQFILIVAILYQLIVYMIQLVNMIVALQLRSKIKIIISLYDFHIYLPRSPKYQNSSSTNTRFSSLSNYKGQKWRISSFFNGFHRIYSFKIRRTWA